MSFPRLAIDVVIPERAARGWQKAVIQRLDAQGHDVAVVPERAKPWPATANAVLALERALFRRRGGALASPLEPIPPRPRRRSAVLRLDLAGNGAPSAVPTIALCFEQSRFDLAAAIAVAAGDLPAIAAVLDGRTVVGRALPMIDRREAASLGIEDVLARAVTLLLSLVQAYAEGRLAPVAEARPCRNEEKAGFLGTYLSRALPRLGREALRRTRFHHAHWRVGYRFHDGPGVAETGMLGTGWQVLPDTGGRFYADPFAFHRQGQPFLFVEDYVHAARKAVISVVPFDGDGRAQAPRVVLEEPHHLSYPQVFERDGAVWMLPEASAGGKLTLYRATDFPDRWRAEAVLVEGEISDATLLDQGGALWLFATSRDGFGSTSDTLVVFEAPRLTGPWRPHPLNPILIDRRRARPGGAFVHAGEGRILLPVQDGTLGYGGGLGLSELLALDGETVRLAPPRPILADGDWPYPRIHTLNRSGPLEVIDGIAAVPRRPVRSSVS